MMVLGGGPAKNVWSAMQELMSASMLALIQVCRMLVQMVAVLTQEQTAASLTLMATRTR